MEIQVQSVSVLNRLPWLGSPRMKLLLVAILGLLSIASHARNLEPADLFRLESFQSASASPDEQLVAIVRVRPKTTARFYGRNFMDGLDRADVWIWNAAAAKGEFRAITDGHTDGAGFFAPTWSPDGAHLAMLSTRGGIVSLWIWRRASRRLSRVSTKTVELGRPVWLSNREVICATPPTGEQPLWFDLDVNATRKAAAAWPIAHAGTTVTASELKSPARKEASHRPAGRLLLFDIGNKKTPVELAKGIFTAVNASSDGRTIGAFEFAEWVTPPDAVPIPSRNPMKYRFVLFERTTDDGLLRRRVGLEMTAGIEPLPGPVAWMADGTVVVRALLAKEKQPYWFAIPRTPGKPVRINTGAASAPPYELAVAEGGTSLLGVWSGQLWRIPLDGRNASPLHLATNRIQSLRIDSLAFLETGKVVVSARHEAGQRPSWFIVDLDADSISEFPQPEGNALAMLPGSRIVLTAAPESAAAGGGTALRMWRVEATEGRLVARINEFTKDIAQGEYQPFSYGSMTGWILLPPGYRKGDRYPAVVSVYPDLVYNRSSPPRGTIQSLGAYNSHLFAAQGYAVVFPSIPLTPAGTPGEPYKQIQDSVLPAIDETIRLGWVDEKRVSVVGHSFGGYAAYALATQTDRFRSVIALSGFANLTSLYGAFDPRFRYDPLVRDRLLFMTFAESGQFRMGSPPWEDAERYVRNSPITYVDRVRTPVLIMQGDQDYVPIQQGEEFFSALFRQNKEAVFVRYWGEGHAFESPANISDMWARIYEWLSQKMK